MSTINKSTFHGMLR